MTTYHSSWLTDAPGRVADARGRPQFTRRTTPAEIARRDGIIAKLYRRGHTSQEIARAIKMSPGTVTSRIQALGLSMTRRYKGAGEVTGTFVWRDEDVEDPEVPLAVGPTRWRQSRIIGMAQMLNEEYRESSFANVLANQVTDAGEAGDGDWMMQALATINAAMEKLERARRILVDDTYRDACRDTHEGVEGLRRPRSPLRAVR